VPHVPGPTPLAALHPVNAFLILGMYGWLFHALKKAPAAKEAAAPATAPTG
jgi:hypothetical protein